MVAVVGRGWRLAPCLVRLIEETDRLFPDRSTASDGSIGDQAHQIRASDHNPDGGYVDAVDITDDDRHGADMSILVGHLVRSKDKRVSYVIHRGTIWFSYPYRGRPAWAPQPYTGVNAHKLHAHISIRDDQRNTGGPWWPPSKPTPPTPPTVEDDDMPWILRAEGKPTRLMSPPVAIVADTATLNSALANGAKTYLATPGDYDDIISQITKALD